MKVRRLGLFALIVWLAGAAAFADPSRETLNVEGLREPVEILRDPWGISHIYAQNQHDLFFAQGFSAARDRLFQLEIWRRRATGTVAEILGPRELDRDIGARLLRPRVDPRREFNHYHPEGEQIIGSFVQGINAYIELTERNPDLLPMEFGLLGITPKAWTPEVIVSRLGGIFRNVGTEIQLAAGLREVGPERTKSYMTFEPGDPDLTVDPAVDLSLIPKDVLKYHRAARSSVRFRAEHIADPSKRNESEEEEQTANLDSREPSPYGDDMGIGSNNWVLSGEKTFTRRPVMANDPHRAVTVPSLRYWVHLNAPGWNVIGGGEPHLPGVSIGHNDYGAWGLTIFATDAEDLYVYETNPENPDQYRYLGQWESMEVHEETIEVKGEEPAKVQLKYTRHGPVLAEDRENHRAYALRAAWLEIGSAPYLASLRIDQATNWEEFLEACSYSRAPSENMVWADTQGNIGWQAVGIVPIRPNWNGLLPVPGDGRFEWDGYLPIHALPRVFNPPEGYWGSANQNNLPAGYPYPISYLWTDPFRFTRLTEVLDSSRRFSLIDSALLQTDEYSVAARMLTPLLRGLSPEGSKSRAAIRILESWDHVLDKDSAAAAIYSAWLHRLRERFKEARVPEELAEAFRTGPNIRRMIDALTTPDAAFGPDPVAGRDAFLLETLEAALEDLTEDLGPNMDLWKYGAEKFHHIELRHPLSRALKPEFREGLDLGPLPRGGDADTLNSTRGRLNQRSGASLRIIADTADWDRSLGVNTPGQSGNPTDPHYGDLFQMWADGRYFPVLFSRDKIEAAAESVTILKP